MKNLFLALSGLLLLWANGGTFSAPPTNPVTGNIADGVYMIVGEGSKSCLDITNGACAIRSPVQIFTCDSTDASNSQKFNVVSDGSGYYTISPAHSDLCLEVAETANSTRATIQQNVCVPGKTSQKWAMSQYGENLEIRTVGTNQCM